MKKFKSAKRSSKKPSSRPAKASQKRRTAVGSVAEYLRRVPEPARSALNQIRAAIREAVPADATEVISYNIPAFKHKKVLVWYAAFTHHCSVFPGAAIVEQFQDDLKGYTIAKGTVQFPLDKPMPLELIKKMTRARVASE